MKRAIFYITSFLLLAGTESCKKLVEAGPPTQTLVSANVYASNSTAAAVLTGIYINMTGISNFNPYFGYVAGLSADELTYYGTNVTYGQYYRNSLLNTSNVSFWTEIYQKYIYTCNDVLANLPNSSVSAAISNQLIGEAKFIRAYYYFYLVNQWGDVPLLTTTNYKVNGTIARAPVNQIYALIKQDLLDAQQLLNDNYVQPDAATTTSERTIPNKSAATALLARIYLYLGDINNHDASAYKAAELQATALINNTALYKLQANLNSVFLANNQEAIWQAQPVAVNNDTFDAVNYILKTAPNKASSGATLSSFLLNSFEPGDKRRTNWVKDTVISGTTYSYAYKYKIANPTNSRAEYTTMLRLAEQYLIRAEARAEQGNTSGAVADLNVIRQRAGLAAYSGATDQVSLLSAILHERQVELFLEYGHRWLDLKRTGQIDKVMDAPGNVCQSKGGTWASYKALFPIPNGDIVLDNNLVQTPGY